MKASHLQSRTGCPGYPGHFRPEGRKQFETGLLGPVSNSVHQATLSVAGSILTPGPMVDEIATRLT